MLRFVLSMTILFTGALRAQDSLYNIADLESLQLSKNYREFIRHAHDIRPSQRDKHWREMVQAMSSEYLDSLLERKDSNEEAFREVEMLASWPILREDLFFIAKRDRYLIEYFKSCLGNKSAQICQKQMLDSFHHLKGEVETVAKMVQVFSDFTPAQELNSLITFVSTHRQARFYCGQEHFAPHLLNYVLSNLPVNFTLKEAESTLTQSTSQECWNEFSPYLKRELYNVPAEMAERYYLLLLSRRMLTLQEEDLFLSYLFLLAPPPDEGLNRAWNKVSELAEDYPRRSAVTKALLAIDPLPGKLFAEKSLDRLKPLFKHFQKTFPEYLDRYVETCLNYMAGIGNFPNGNPTVYCRELFQLSDRLGWPEEPIRQKFSALKK